MLARAISRLAVVLTVAFAGVILATAVAFASDYTVKPGDTLSRIANAQGVDSWRTIYEANRDKISNPNLIYPGQKLSLSGKARTSDSPSRSSSSGSSSSSSASAPSDGSWEAIAACIREIESNGNYQAINPSGKYRGAYQFDIPTWQSVGGSGDPAAASPAEQDRRAYLLYQSRGLQPWPTPSKRC